MNARCEQPRSQTALQLNSARPVRPDAPGPTLLLVVPSDQPEIATGLGSPGPLKDHQSEARPLFNALELAAIRFGATDPMQTFDPDALLGRMLVLLFGLRSPARLADPKLEAIRSLVLALRGRSHHLAKALETAASAGVSQAQIDDLTRRAQPRSTPAGNGRRCHESREGTRKPLCFPRRDWRDQLKTKDHRHENPCIQSRPACGLLPGLPRLRG